MEIQPLTAEESQFAAEHAGLIADYLHWRRLPECDYYDVAAFGYLKAVQKQFRNPCEPERQNFPALARVCMRYAVISQWRYDSAEKRGGDTVSLDAAMSPDSETPLHEAVPDPAVDIARQYEAKEAWARVHERGSDLELELLDLFAYGYDIREAARIMKLSARKCEALLRSIRKKTAAAKAEYLGAEDSGGVKRRSTKKEDKTP